MADSGRVHYQGSMRAPRGVPCTECPFRRKSLAGYLGADTLEPFLRTALGEEMMPCHQDIDYENSDDWSDQLPNAHECSGRAIFLSNVAKLPRNRNITKLPADRARVFASSVEFLEHHGD